jgi:hypothetical protein
MPKTYPGGLLVTRELCGFVYAKSHVAARRRFRVPGASAVDWDTAHNDPKRPSNARIYFVVDRVTLAQSAREAARAQKRNARFFAER